MISEIRIALDQNGDMRLHVEGAAGANKVIALGMLELAAELIKHPPQQSPIVQARDIPLLNGHQR